jgi:hypothetical protein
MQHPIDDESAAPANGDAPAPPPGERPPVAPPRSVPGWVPSLIALIGLLCSWLLLGGFTPTPTATTPPTPVVSPTPAVAPSPTATASPVASPSPELGAQESGSAGVAADARALYATRQRILFSTLASVQIALWFVIAVAFALPAGKAVWRRGLWRGSALVLSTLPTVLLVALLNRENAAFYGAPLLAAYGKLWPDHEARMVIAIIGGMVALLPLLTCLRLVDEDAAQLPARYTGDLKTAIGELLQLRTQLQSHLAALSAMLVMVIVVVEALRRFVNASYLLDRGLDPTSANLADLHLAPQEGIVVYGLLYTLLLALVYVPTHVSLARAGRWLLEQAAPLPDPTIGAASPDDWKAHTERRKSLEELLELKQNPLDMIRSSFAVLAPFVTTLIGAALPIAK